MRTYKIHPILNALLLLGLFTLSVYAQNCTIDDYSAQYSQCRPDLSHDLLWYKNRNSTCSGGVDVPPPVFDLPCNITCDEGEYLPLGGLNCTACEPGSFSRGGGRTVEDWYTWPTDLGIISTFCVNNLIPNTPPINCSGWILTGKTLRSGIITEVQTSVLTLQTQLVIAGVIRFSYRVDAEPFYDGLIFYVDGVILLPKVSVTNFYVDFAADVTAGYHTFRWEYYKDRSVDKGADAAFIRSLEISGLTYSESSCTSCDPGTQAPGNAALQCDPCPLNSFAGSPGSPSCLPCLAGQFSYAGSSACMPKVPCTANDYQILYGPCTASNTRSAVASWLLPHICDDSALPLPITTSVPCAPCLPGYAIDGSFDCVPCPTGTYSGDGRGACASCPAGSAAPKSYNLAEWDSWLPTQATYCTGYCGTNGWRLRSGFIDSGVGHGDTVNSVFSFNVTLEQPGIVAFTFRLNCSRFCTLSYLDYPYDASVYWNTTSAGNNVYFSYSTPTPLEIGDHELVWSFSEDPYDPTPNNYTDNAQIFNINVQGTTGGGAISCSACSNGTITPTSTSFCSNCTSGASSNFGNTECDPCTGNTYSARPADNCNACGPTTVANSGHTDCTDTCSFYLGDDLYDITGLANQGPIGPVSYDIYSYYINLCGRGNFSSLCNDEDDNPLITHVCQVLPYGYALDVGWTTGYYSIPTSTATYGFRVHYDMGTLGCGPKNNGVNYPRNSDLTFICDPTAGVGILQGLGVVESPPCHYSFTINSIYACPVCTAAHYSFYYTTCNSQGSRQKVYYWNDPILCHDGVKLPAAEQVDCSDGTFFCGIGELLGADGQSCLPCPAGEYSVGGGLLISSWPTGIVALPYDYISSCDTVSCTLWTSEDGISIHSGVDGSSLTGSHLFRTTGSVSFNYKLFSSDDGVFSFYIDGILQLATPSGLSYFDWNVATFPLAVGSHTFQWKFSNGLRYSPSLLDYQGVSISNIFLQGLDFHADTCLPCPDGTYSSNDTSVIGCVPCPANTYTTSQTAVCSPCTVNQYSFPGASSCIPKSVCTLASYKEVPSSCGLDGTRNISFTKILPNTCVGGPRMPRNQTNVPCAPCPAYTFLSQGVCIGCPIGQFYRDNGCVSNTAGNIVQYTQAYFGDDSLSTWPPAFYTGCSGGCGTDGWRINGSVIDSGFHGSNTVDSYVGILANFVVDGVLTFTYFLNATGPTTGFQFAIDNVVLPIPQPPPGMNTTTPVTVTITIAKGLHDLVWNYHQEAGTGLAQLTGFALLGVEGAIGASEGVACQPGQFSNDPTALNCSLCIPGTFASVPGSTLCAQCIKNTYNPNFGADECPICDEGSSAPTPGSTQCQTTCVFTLNGGTYALGLTGNVTVFDDERRKYVINVCNNVLPSCPKSHSCIINTDGSIIEAGNSFRFAPSPDNSTALPFSIYFEHGESCPGSDSQRATVINFECSPDDVASFPNFLSADDDSCLTTFSWKTLVACPKCTDSDYTTVRGVCSGGNRKIAKTRITYCNGPESIEVPDESCSAAEFPTGAIVAVVLIFVAVVAVAGFIFFRNRRLAKQYASLVEETRSTNTSL